MHIPISLQSELPFKKELLGLRYDCDDKRHNHGDTERDYYYKSFNDYIVGVFDSPQVLQLEILPNQSGDEQILSFGVSDGLPLASAGVNIIHILNKIKFYILNELLTTTYAKEFTNYNVPTCLNILPKMTHKYAVKSSFKI